MNTVAVSYVPFFDQQKAQLQATRITEQPVLLTKSKINRSIFAKKGQSNLLLVLVLVLESNAFF